MSESDLYFNPDLETMSQDEIIARQNERLKEKVRYVMANNAYLRDLYTKAGVVAEDFRGVEDIEKLPILAKANFRETYPLGMCCVPKNLIREMHMSSGSTGTRFRPWLFSSMSFHPVEMLRIRMVRSVVYRVISTGRP